MQKMLLNISGTDCMCERGYRQRHTAIGSLSESGGRGRPAMTAAGFNQRLTGGGEAARLIDYRQRLSSRAAAVASNTQH